MYLVEAYIDQREKINDIAVQPLKKLSPLLMRQHSLASAQSLEYL